MFDKLDIGERVIFKKGFYDNLSTEVRKGAKATVVEVVNENTYNLLTRKGNRINNVHIFYLERV